MRNDISGGSDESLNNLENTLTSGTLSKDQTSLSHPDLSEIQKTRALTLPARGFRTGNFKSSYPAIGQAVDPHKVTRTRSQASGRAPLLLELAHKL